MLARINIVEITRDLTYLFVNGYRSRFQFGRDTDTVKLLHILRANRLLPTDVLWRVIPLYMVEKNQAFRDVMLLSNPDVAIDFSVWPDIDERMWQ